MNRLECENKVLDPPVQEEFFMTIEIENEGVSFINIGDSPAVVNISSTLGTLRDP